MPGGARKDFSEFVYHMFRFFFFFSCLTSTSAAAAGYPPPRCPRRRQGPKVRRKSLEKTISISCQQFKPLLPDALSHFSLSRVTVGDSGNYSCRAAGLREEATVNVHVLVDGEIVEKYHKNTKFVLNSLVNFLSCED